MFFISGWGKYHYLDMEQRVKQEKQSLLFRLIISQNNSMQPTPVDLGNP
jgi:hypothetical protein